MTNATKQRLATASHETATAGIYTTILRNIRGCKQAGGKAIIGAVSD